MRSLLHRLLVSKSHLWLRVNDSVIAENPGKREVTLQTRTSGNGYPNDHPIPTPVEEPWLDAPANKEEATQRPRIRI